MQIRVDSEVGRLRRVLVHRPGREIDRMVPSMMAELLFDDILDGQGARREHERFTAVLESAGVRVAWAQELLAEILVEDEPRRWLLAELGRAHGAVAGAPGAPDALDRLADLDAVELARALVAGVREPAEAGRPAPPRLFRLDPLPNYFFQRDPQVVIGDRVLVAAMATAARRREPLLARALFTFHPDLAGGGTTLFDVEVPPPGGDPGAGGPGAGAANPFRTLEGGDVLVASPEVVLVGISERTNRWGVEYLAEYLRREETPFRHLLVVELPHRRSYMHLDTVFTFIDRGLGLGYRPVVEPGTPESAHVYHVDLEAKELAFSVRPSLRRALADAGLEVDLVPCGGGADLLDQEREQWTDGANAFALAPGVIVLYRRNRKTCEELAARGWRILGEEEVGEGGEPVLGRGPTVVTLEGNELSRARGGPRCMAMPLEREAL
jgi:arginine deiminase